MAIRFLDTILSGSLAISGSYTLPIIDTGSTGVIGQMGINGEVPHFYSSQGWQAVSGSKFTPIPPPSIDIEYLIVAGGGGGGGTIAGGGGAGGLLSGSISSVESGSSFTIVVGAGGDGGHGWDTYTAASPGATSSLAGSSITTISTVGGGLGGDHYGNSSTNNLPGDGGSGGGGGRGTSYPLAGGSGTAGQGNDGGSVANSSTGENYGSGGGGAGAAGDAAGADADGGIGKQSSITGTATYYAGGGGGGVRSSAGSDVGEGGSGGGGAGGTAQSATAGTANTGGGGGGAGYTGPSSAETGGKGGSGVVILAYQTGSFNARGGGRRYFDDRVAHIFNSSGTFTMEGTKTLTHNTKDVFGDSSCLAFYQLDGNANEFGGTSGRLTGNAATFNGSSSILTMNQATVLGNTFGVTFWINIPSTPPDNDYIFWFGYGQNVGLYIDSSGVLQVYIGSYSQNESYATSQTISTNTWYHVVLTCDSSTVTCYVNGVNKGTGGLLGGQNTTMTYQNVIGGYNSSTPSNHISMKMEDFRIYNRHITSTEASNLYNDTDISSTSLANRYIMKTDFTDSVGSRDLTNSNVTFSDLDGTASNVTYSQGYINNGGVFNGSSSYISVDGSILNSLTAASYTAWVYYKGTGSGQSYGHIVSGGATNSTSSGKAFGMAVRNSDDLLYIWASNSETSFTSTALPENVWTHLAVTNSGGTAKMYMNGSLIHTSNPTSLAFNSSSNNLRIGEYFYNGSHHFYGEIDQVRIFNKVLSASEVLTLYNE